MTEEPIEAVIARLRHSTNLGWVDSADGHEGATVRVSDLSRLLDYTEIVPSDQEAIDRYSPPTPAAAGSDPARTE